MKKAQIIIGIALVVSFSVMQLASVADAQTTRFEQYVSPKECVKETINNGVTTQVILSPQECEELLNPKPPEPPKEPESPKPPVVIERNDQNGPKSPNTGYVQQLTDMVIGNKDGVFFVLMVSGGVLFVLIARRLSRLHSR